MLTMPASNAINIATQTLKKFNSEFAGVGSYTLSTMGHSLNNTAVKEASQGLFLDINDLRDMMHTLCNKEKTTLGKYVEQLKTQVKRFGVADCGERSEIIKYELKQQGIQARTVNISSLHADEGADHSFVLYNTSPKAILDKPETWGDEAIIVDPLLGLSGKAADILPEINKTFKFDKPRTKLDIREIDRGFQETLPPSLGEKISNAVHKLLDKLK